MGLLDRAVDAVMLAVLALVVGGCSVARLEDVPSTAAIDGQKKPSVADLATPPQDFLTPRVASKEVASMSAEKEHVVALGSPGLAASADAALVERSASPNAFEPGTLPNHAVWFVRYGSDGFDAEDADGNYCSGQVSHGDPAPRRGLSVKMACNTGEMAQLLIETAEAGSGTGEIVIGGRKEGAVIR